MLELTAKTFDEIARTTVYSTPASPLTLPDRSGKDITLFVACYNEEENIIATFTEVISAMAGLGLSWEIIVIDDASTDNSVQLVKRYMCDHPDCPIILLVREENQGVAQNFIEAAFLGRGRYFRLINGDNVENSATIASILRHIGEADMLVPFHTRTLSRTLFRRLLSRAFTLLVNLLSGYRIKYYNGCCVHLRHNVMRWQTNRCGFDFQADLILRLLDQGRTFIEIPVPGGERAFGSSKALTLRNFISAAGFFLGLVVRRICGGLILKKKTTPR